MFNSRMSQTAPLVKGDPRLIIAHENEVVMNPKQLSQVRPVGDPRTFKPEMLDAIHRAIETYGTRGMDASPVATLQPRRDDNLNSSVVPQFADGGRVSMGRSMPMPPISDPSPSRGRFLGPPVQAFAKGGKVGSDKKCPTCGQSLPSYAGGGQVMAGAVYQGMGLTGEVPQLWSQSQITDFFKLQRENADILNPPKPGLTV